MKPPPDPVCACGHPRATHHRTDSGAITYCTVWSHTAPGVGLNHTYATAARQCPCKRYKEAA